MIITNTWQSAYMATHTQVCGAMYADVGAICRNMYGRTYCRWCYIIMPLFIANINNCDTFNYTKRAR